MVGVKVDTIEQLSSKALKIMEKRLEDRVDVDRTDIMQQGTILVYTAGINRLKEADDAEFENCLNRIPQWRRQRILSYRNRDDRLRSLACSLLLAEGCAELGWDPQGYIGENGRPMLLEKGHYISLAHAGDYAVAAFSEEPVGIDVEEIARFTSERREKIGRKILTEAEKEYLHQLMSDCVQATAFAEIWTRKEAFVKCNGKGLSMDFREIETMQEDLFYSCAQSDNYLISVCGSNLADIREVRI